MGRKLPQIILLIGIAGATAAYGRDWDTTAVIPADSIATAVVSVDDSNAAMQSFVRILLNDYLRADVPEFVQQNLLFLLSGEVAVTMTGAASAEEVDYAIMTEYVKDSLEITLPFKNAKIQLSGRDPEKMKSLYNWLFGLVLDELVARGNGQLQREAVAGGELTFNPAGEHDSNPSAYAMVGSTAILGSTTRAVRHLAASVDSTKGGLGENKHFATLRGRIPPEADGFVFIDNSSQRFGLFLQNYEKALDRTVIRIAELLDAVLFTFTLVDETHLAGKAWFVPLDGISVDVLEGCGSSFDELVRNELHPVNLDFTSTFVSTEGMLEMDFAVEDKRKPPQTP